MAQNIIWNWSGRILEAVVGFFVMPYLIIRLGDTSYGLWNVISAMSGYFGILDLGMCGSVGRYVALYKAKNDQARVNATFSTAVLLMLGLGAVGLVGMTLSQFIFFKIFPDVPLEQLPAARWALFLLGLNLALMFLFSAFDAMLWAYQRFDLLNVTNGTSALVRAALTFTLIDYGSSVVRLGLITLGATAIVGIIKVILVFRVDPQLRVGPAHFQKAVVPELFGYGIWRFLMVIGRMGTTRLNIFVIGHWLTLGAITPYILAVRLMSYTVDLLDAIRETLTPVATTKHAQNRDNWQPEFLIEGCKLSFAVALFFFTLFAFLGTPLIEIWAQPKYAFASTLLVILTAGELIPMTQAATTSMILGTGKHRVLALLHLFELVLVLTLSIAVATPYGLTGLCVVQAVSATLCRGILQCAYALRQAKLSLWDYLARAVLPPAVLALAPVGALAALVNWHRPANRLELLGYGATYGIVYLLACLPLLGYSRVWSRVRAMVRSEAV
jgi:O-antigen/teichoic acid export membrane protein